MAKAIPTPAYTHSLPALGLLRKPSYGLANRRKQPERYTQINKSNSVKTIYSKTLFPRLAPSMAQGGSSWGQKKLILYIKHIIE
jgi:hypothetical protein